MSDNRLQELIASWLDGRLDAESSQELQQELLRSEAARSVFRKYTQFDAALYEFSDTSGMLAGSPLLQVCKPSSGLEPAVRSPSLQSNVNHDANVGLNLIESTETKKLSFRRRFASLGLLAAVILFSIVTYALYEVTESATQKKEQAALAQQIHSADDNKSVTMGRSHQGRPPAPVATLSYGSRARWEKPHRLVGQALYEGETVTLKKGEVRVSVGCGAEILAKAPFSLTFLTKDRVRLHRGIVAIDVAPWAKGFTVVTNDMDIVDLGTTFMVSAVPGKATETTVLKGVVRVHPSEAMNEKRRGLLLSEGQRFTLSGRSPMQRIQQESVGPLLQELDFGSPERYRPVALHNTGLGLSVGDEDMHWKVVAGPLESSNYPRYASVCVPHERYLANDATTSQWVSIAKWQTAEANAIYTFQTNFTLDSYDLSTIQLFGRFLADNGVSSVRVNGEPVPVESWVDNIKYQPFGSLQFRYINVTGGLVQGLNTIEVDVNNGMQRMVSGDSSEPKLSPIPNPMALRVEWFAFGRQHRLASSEVVPSAIPLAK